MQTPQSNCNSRSKAPSVERQLEIQQAPRHLQNSIIPVTNKPIQIALRPAVTQDFEYCERLYFSGMKTIIKELHLDIATQTISFREQWIVTEVRIITANGSDVGWLQTAVRDDALFVAQLFVDGPFQRQGIGTEVMNRLIGEAALLSRAVHLAVVKINPALRLYERLGFHTAYQDDRKFYMKRDPDIGASI